MPDIAAIAARVRSQAELLPALYGQIDFDTPPERFADGPDDRTELSDVRGKSRADYLADSELVARIREYSLLGDITGDAYAALMPQFGFRRLVDMLVEACDKGVDAVEGAPPELKALISEMERIPDWLDMKLVEQGAKAERNSAANISPFAIRGAFIATFLNKYSALPMALTGTLSHATAARRVKETATFFTTTVLPGALKRHGAGFKAAAMVRLMHSMVRANVLSRPGMWDAKVYGIPIPQLDQMPAGLIPIYFMSEKVLGQGRTSFNAEERAKVELARYRCYLLGLPEDLLADNPTDIVRIWCTRSATLRYEYDDAICGGLLRATMEAELSKDRSLPGRVFRRLERSFARVFFVNTFLKGDEAAAATVGVPLTGKDKALYAATMAAIIGQTLGHKVASRLPVLGEVADQLLVSRLRRQLADYGHAEFTTDAAQYRPATS
ncbi:MAG TPA: oxygenase MpaB family protein [Sphingorhabdus sp.]|uniref:oxygenase MpaB family protein n=1 Tax=Sphingorhabdus sp. TaxID=1902408 RepID=UPI002CCF2025|nr:oxygenase MpaB family protein [Sphingorhabdus sp.]HMT40988.1 oxygenase MpaB family protein [Sphingorhabdus sp.]HMU21495.1 oxygenase MpaB family protein [Sphingorhabdus sp.]